jgi:alpha-galactosidase
VSVFETVAELAVDADRARVYEHGWQSWSPTGTYPVTATSHAARRIMCYRPETPAPETGFQGEGLLAVDAGHDGPVHVFAAANPQAVPSIRASYVDRRLVVSADGELARVEVPGPLPTALGAWGTTYAATAGAGELRPAPTVWCSWYHYFTKVTQADIVENLDAIGAAELTVDVVQIDDGWQTEIGDWLTLSDRFASLPALVHRIRSAGRRAGIWVAPFLVGARSVVAARHPGWLIAGPDGMPVSAGHNWGQDLFGLDVTHPVAERYLRDVFGWLASIGIDYFKIDFIYGGALAGSRHTGVDALAAYRRGVGLVREVIGPEAYLLGCGAPILPSVGLVDAMRVSPDIALEYEPADGDLSQPSQRSAALSTVGRAWQHGRFWVNDPDCLVARPAVQRREEWATIVERYGGLRASSDRIADLDDWGMRTTRRLLASVPPPAPFDQA